jgi:hypothetical protein
MRSFFVLSLGCVIGCGGAVALDSGDASTDASTDAAPADGPPGFDSPGPPVDAVVHDAPPPCPIRTDPCFSAFVGEAEKAAACMAHPDTCAVSGGKDASGCGVRTPSSGGGSSCSWPDGAKTFDDRTSGGAINGHGATCYKYTVTSGTGTADVSVTFADGATYVEHIEAPGTSAQITIVCPDGTRSPPFTSSESAACGLAVTCCSSTTPPTCGP